MRLFPALLVPLLVVCASADPLDEYAVVVPAGFQGPAAAPHPSAVVATIGDRRDQVVGARGNIALVDPGRGPVRVPASGIIEPIRVARFGPGEVRITVDSFGGFFSRRGIQPDGSDLIGGRRSLFAHFRGHIRPSLACRNCYIVFLGFDPEFMKGKTEEASAFLSFQELGDLAAGVDIPVSADFNFIASNPQVTDEVPMVFSRGVEIRSNYSDMLGAIFRFVEVARHRRLLKAYLAKAAATTAPAKGYLHFPPVFQAGLDRSSLPASVRID